MAIYIGSKRIDIIDGSASDDLIISGKGDDIIVAGDGDDIVIAGSGDDTVYGGAGDDFINGGSGDDTLDGGEGDDFIIGGSGDDIITDGAGNDIVLGSGGSDSLSYDVGLNTGYTDFFHGGGGDDTLTITFTTTELYNKASSLGFSDTQSYLAALQAYFNNASNIIDLSGFGFNLYVSGIEHLNVVVEQTDIIGTNGDDTISGTDGNDTIFGLDGNDTIDGQAGDDVIDAGAGNDVVSAGAGDDTVTGGLGDDVLAGGAGNDMFILQAGDGIDQIDGGLNTDRIDITTTALNITAVNNGAILNYGTDQASTESIEIIEANVGSSGTVFLDLNDTDAALSSVSQINADAPATLDLSSNSDSTLSFNFDTLSTTVSSNNTSIDVTNFDTFNLGGQTQIVNVDREVSDMALKTSANTTDLVINVLDNSDGVIAVDNSAGTLNSFEINFSDSPFISGADTIEIDPIAQTITRIDNATSIEFGLVGSGLNISANGTIKIPPSYNGSVLIDLENNVMADVPHQKSKNF